MPNNPDLVLVQVQIAPHKAEAIGEIVKKRRSDGQLIQRAGLVREWIDEGIAREKRRRK